MIRHFFQKIILVSMAIGMSAVVNGQTNNEVLFDPDTPTSPQAEAFKRFGENTVNNQMGVPDITIPLYEINHRGYKIPLALTYVPPTLKPGYNYDVFGSGWALSFKSCISRSIYTLADEKANFELNENAINMYYNPYNDAAYNLPNLLKYYNYGHDKYHAILPDGSSFDFVIGKVNGNLVYKISDGRQVIITHTSTAKFIITDESGVKYTFDGGDVFYDPFSPNNGSYVSWQLVQIDLPYSDDPITFGYNKIISTNIIEMAFSDEPEAIFEHTNIYPLCAPPDDYNPGIYTANVYSNLPTLKPYDYSLQVLSDISWGNSSVSMGFKYSSDNDKGHGYVPKIRIYDGAYSADIDLDMTDTILDYKQYKQPLAKLDSIIIRPNNSEPQRYSFSYEDMQTGFNGLDHWGNLINVYNYYNGVAGFNVYSEIDGSTIQSNLVTYNNDNNNTYGKFRLAPDNCGNRMPVPPNYYGVLKKIVYPTGGYTEFQFENNEFLTRTDNKGDYINDPNNRERCQGPGFRIRKITNYTADQQIADVKTYRYGNIQQNSNTHTGLGIAVVDPNVLTYMKFDCTGPYIQDIFCGDIPINSDGEIYYTPHDAYVICFTESFSVLDMLKNIMPTWKLGNPFSNLCLRVNDITWGYACRFSADNFRNLLNGRPPVIYSEFTIYNGDIGDNDEYHPENTSGKTVYQYDVMDQYSVMEQCGAAPIEENVFFEEPLYMDDGEGHYFNLSYYENSSRYNKLSKKTDYRYDLNTQEYKPVSQESYDWKYAYLKDNPFYDWINTRPFFMTFFGCDAEPDVKLSRFFSRKGIGLSNAQLQQKTTTAYYENNITSTESYQYNDRNQLILKKTANSDGKNYETTYQYPEILQTGTPPVITDMVNRNIISPVIGQKTSLVLDYWHKDVVAGDSTEFDKFNTNTNSIIMPSKAYQIEAKSSNPEYELRQQVLCYTANGNPMEVEHDGFHTVYLWGYNDRYPIAKIENATYNDLKTALGGVAPETVELAAINNLRNTPANFMITTYTYQPPFGIISETDPSGKTVFFKYDTSGRLIEATNEDGKILEEHEYNYAK